MKEEIHPRGAVLSWQRLAWNARDEKPSALAPSPGCLACKVERIFPEYRGSVATPPGDLDEDFEYDNVAQHIFHWKALETGVWKHYRRWCLWEGNICTSEMDQILHLP